jgi:hypothetical protein
VATTTTSLALFCCDGLEKKKKKQKIQYQVVLGETIALLACFGAKLVVRVSGA